MDVEPPRLRVAFLGNDPWSVPSLEALTRSRHHVELVLTRDARPAGRGHRLRRTRVAEAAERLGVVFAETPTVKRGDGFEALSASSPDVLAVVAYGEILPRDVFAGIPRLGTSVNVHFSLLPRWRGAAPVRWAILAGDERTGVTAMEIADGLDEGRILRQEATRIRDGEDAGTLGARLALLGGRLLVETLDGLASGALDGAAQEQDGTNATLAPRLAPGERRIDWSRPAGEVVRRVRAFGPEPGAVTTFRRRNLKVLRAEMVPDGPVSSAGTPGACEIVHGELVVLAGSGRVRLLEVALEGRARMSGAELVRGHRPGQDDVLA